MKKLKIKNLKSKVKKRKIIMAFILVFLGILFRTTWHLGPNVEFVTAATLLSSCYLGKKWAFIVPILIMFISDMMIGNTNIFIFTWSAYIIIGYIGNLSHLGQLSGREGLKRVFLGTGLGIVASFWFYLWTNFGVWLLDIFGMYEKTVSGLLTVYLMGLPFLKYNLIGNLVFVPISFLLVEASRKFVTSLIKSKNNRLFKFFIVKS